MKLPYLLPVFLGIVLFACSEASFPDDVNEILEGPCLDTLTATYYRPNLKTSLQTTKGPALMDQCRRRTPKDDVNKYLSLSTDIICIMDQNFEKILDLEGSNCCSDGLQVENLDKYVYQYMGLEIGGEDYIYVNAAAVTEDELEILFPDWVLEPISNCGGETDFWGALFNINSTEFSDLQFNDPR